MKEDEITSVVKTWEETGEFPDKADLAKLFLMQREVYLKLIVYLIKIYYHIF